MRKTKKNIIYLFLIALAFSCTKDDSESDENEIIQEVEAGNISLNNSRSS